MVHIVQSRGQGMLYRIFAANCLVGDLPVACGTAQSARTVLLRQIHQHRLEYFDQGIQVMLVVSPGIDGA